MSSEDDLFEQELLKNIDEILSKYELNEESKTCKARRSNRRSASNSVGNIGRIQRLKQQKKMRHEMVSKMITKETSDALTFLGKNQHCKYSLMSVKEEKKLSENVKIDEKAREKLVLSNLSLVLYAASKYQGLGLDFEDLVQEGYIGLIKAVDNYDPNLGNRFTTYAFWRVIQEMEHAISEYGGLIKIPIALYKKVKHIKGIHKRFWLEYNRSPSLEELSKYSGIDIKQVAKIQGIPFRIYPLDIPIKQLNLEDSEEQYQLIRQYGSDSCFEDLLVDERSTKEKVRLERMVEDIIKILNTFPERNKQILLLLFGLQNGEVKTLEEAGKAFGIGRERVRQIRDKALARLSRQLLGYDITKKKRIRKKGSRKLMKEQNKDQDLSKILHIRFRNI